MSDAEAIDYREWDDHQLGLSFAQYRNIVHYYPNAPFFVDGVRYQATANTGPLCKRTMIEIFDDGGGDAEMWASDPPTESELDQYVRSGRIGGWRVP